MAKSLRDSVAGRPARSRRRSLVARAAAGVAVAVACGTALSACEPGAGEPGAEDDPVAATRDFITDGMIDSNGFLACAYLTREQQRAASERAGGGQCRQAFDAAEFMLGGERIDTVYEVNHLTADATVDGNRATVELSRGGDAVEFRLVKADFAEQEEFEAPDTEWRIAKGALPFIPRLHKPVADSAVKQDARIDVR